MASNRSRCVRLSVTSPTILAVSAALLVLIFIPGSTCQRASVYAPVVVSAHDPASANPMLGAAFSPSAHAASSPEPPAAQGLPPEGTAAPAPSTMQSAALHVTPGHTDNDVHLQASSSALPSPTGNATLHVEAREEANNRIADPRVTHSVTTPTVSAAPAASNDSAPAASNASGAAAPAASESAATASESAATASESAATASESAVPGDAADIAHSANATPRSNRTADPIPITVITVSSSQYPIVFPEDTNVTQTPSAASSVSTIPASPADPTQNATADSNQTSRSFQDDARLPIQYVAAGQRQNFPQVPSRSKDSAFVTSEKGAPVVTGASVTTTTTDVRPVSDGGFGSVQNSSTDSEYETFEYPDERATGPPEDTTTGPLSTVTDVVGDETTTYIKLQEDVPASGGGAASPNASNFPFDGEPPETHPCARECVLGAPPMRCHYRFEVTGYYTMSKACYDCPARREDCDLPHCVPADGVPRGLVVVNRQMPGPAVEVCLGDRVIVDLHNGLVAETTSVHWHGHHQRGTPYMDGVPHVTQCPVPPMTTFRYAFTADTPGTHFWHSHSGHQRADGAFGALVVRVPREEDAHAELWDRDERAHSLLLLDWGAAGGAERFMAHHHASGPNKPTALLVNGRGRVPPSPPFVPPPPTPTPTAPAAPSNASAQVPIPAPEFVVKQGLRYRFRLINAGFLNCPIEISVDDHDMLIIASDGSDIHPVPAASLVTYAGERFDFVLEANRSVGAYWIRMRGLLDCGKNFTAVHQAAILRYEGATEIEPSGELSYDAADRAGHKVNSLNVGTGQPGSSVIPELDALVEDDESLKEEPDFKFYVAYDFYALDNPHFHVAPHYGFHNVTKREQQTYTPQFNHISMKMPAVPMLSQHDELDQWKFCNASSLESQDCKKRYCECEHVIQVPLHSVFEIVLVDEGKTYNANHPFHLHGYAFRVVGMERLGESTTLDHVKSLDARGLLKRKLHAAPLKDTCTVPDGGYTILRVKASNPGYWLFHCHIEFHVEIGMALVFKIGEHSDFPPVPKGFPRCGDWTPEDDLDLDFDLDLGVGAEPEDARKSGSEGGGEDASENEVARALDATVNGTPQKSRLHEAQPATAPRNAAAAAILSTSVLLAASVSACLFSL